MKNPVPILFLLMLLAPAAQADPCLERLVRFASPVFPKSLEEIKILEKERFCAIDVAYSINMDGGTENIEARPKKGICRPFSVPAIRAIRGSEFHEGGYMQLCFITVILGVENGQGQWRFSTYQSP